MPGENCAVCFRARASDYLRNMYFSHGGVPAEDAAEALGKCFGDSECWMLGFNREKARADAAEEAVFQNRKDREHYLATEEALAAARRECEAHKEALSDLMKLINEGALVRNIGQDGEPGWTLRAMRLVMALKHAYALVPDLATPASAPGEET